MRIRTIAAISAALVPLAVAATPGQAASVASTSPYVVVLRDGSALTPDTAARLAESLGGDVSAVWHHAVRGFAATMTPGAAAALAGNADVKSVEHDAVFSIATTQTNLPNWGLDRIDQRNLPLSASYTYTATGSGVKVYVADSGIRFSHTQFGGRAVSGVDTIDGGTADDCNGHGTHVAGIVGGATVGPAKSATLVGVRVLDCAGNGTLSSIVGGMDYVVADHAAGTPAVVNLSLGGGANATIDSAVQSAINDGVTAVVAAGNGNFAGRRQDACGYSPARLAGAITVGATDKTDKAASFSNYGTCVDILGPGVDILSAWYTGDTAGATVSGTSQATPHVAGVAALYLQGNPTASVATVTSAIINGATTGVISNNPTGTPNRLLFTAY